MRHKIIPNRIKLCALLLATTLSFGQGGTSQSCDSGGQAPPVNPPPSPLDGPCGHPSGRLGTDECAVNCPSLQSCRVCCIIAQRDLRWSDAQRQSCLNKCDEQFATAEPHSGEMTQPAP